MPPKLRGQLPAASTRCTSNLSDVHDDDETGVILG